MEARVVAVREVGEEASGPGAAVAAVGGQIGIQAQRVAGWHWDDVSAGLKLLELGVVFDANQALGLVAFILAHQGFERAAQGRDETDAGDARNRSVGGHRFRSERSGASAGVGDRIWVGRARQGLGSSVDWRDRIDGRLGRSDRRG